MNRKGIFNFPKQTRILIVILVCFSGLGFLIAYVYYNYQNKSVDPRVIRAREKLEKFEVLMNDRRYQEALHVLDTVEMFYLNTPGYKGSFELGVINNNRGSVYLSKALYDSLTTPHEKVSLLDTAAEHIQKSVIIYERWIDSVGLMNREQIKSITSRFFTTKVPELHEFNIGRLIEKRVEDVIYAQTETPRRLSVSFTNLGIIRRHQYKQEEAVQYYIMAIKQWKDNYTARNNLNVLMGKPPEDRSVFDKLFPPERIEE
jgi:tetratricopeptide (TPR) repeat protein